MGYSFCSFASLLRLRYARPGFIHKRKGERILYKKFLILTLGGVVYPISSMMRYLSDFPVSSDRTPRTTIGNSSGPVKSSLSVIKAS